MTEQSIYSKQLTDLAIRSLLQIPHDMKKSFPSVLSKPDIIPLALINNSYFLLIFVDKEESNRINKLIEAGRDPFPYLIKPKNVKRSSAFGLNKTRYFLIDNVTCKDIFCFSLGKDCSIILCDLKQIITFQKKIPPYEHVIDLAYIISFGDEINQNNLKYFLEDLIAYSIRHWRADIAK